MRSIIILVYAASLSAGYYVLPNTVPLNRFSLGLHSPRARISLVNSSPTRTGKFKDFLAKLLRLPQLDDELDADKIIGLDKIVGSQEAGVNEQVVLVSKRKSRKVTIPSLLAMLVRMKRVALRVQEKQLHKTSSVSSLAQGTNALESTVDRRVVPKLSAQNITEAKRLLDEIKHATKALLLSSSPIEEDQSSKKDALNNMWAEVNRFIPTLQEWFDLKIREKKKDIDGAHRELVYLKLEIRNIADDIYEMQRMQDETPVEHWRRKKVDSWEFKETIIRREHELKEREKARNELHDWLSDALDEVFEFFQNGIDRPDLLAERMHLEKDFESSDWTSRLKQMEKLPKV